MLVVFEISERSETRMKEATIGKTERSTKSERLRNNNRKHSRTSGDGISMKRKRNLWVKMT
jgi:hypothetical protein